MKIQLHGHVTKTGVATYQGGLAQALRELGHEVVESRPWKREAVILGKRVGGFITQSLSSRFTKPQEGVEVVHASSNWVYPRACGSVIVHDLTPLHVSGYEPSRRMFQKQKRRLRDAMLLTGSESTRQSIADWLGIDVASITVAYHGIDPAMFGACDQVRGGYLLSVGDYRPYKRVEDAVTLAHFLGLKLVRVGPTANDSYGRSVHDYGVKRLGRGFYDLGYVTRPHLASLYEGAQAVVSTSRHEGFNLPPMEAAASGTPSILADTPVHREIHGDWACYLKPGQSKEQILDRVRDLQNTPLSLRRNAERFTWRRSAERHLEAWRRP